MASVRRERWTIKGKQRNVYVSRSKTGKLLSWKLQAGSELTLQEARNRFKSNNTFRKDIVVQRKKLTNVSEIVIYSKSGKAPSKPSKNAQYICEGRYKGKKIIARSQKIGEALTPDVRSAKENARESFFRLLSQEISGGYDENEGRENFDKVKNYREGWVYYT